MTRVPQRDDLGAVLARMERQIAELSRSSRLVYSSIDDGAVQIVTDGSLRGLIGQQPDGTTAINIVNGPPPPTPSKPEVTGVLGGLHVSWDGTFEDSLVAPLDFVRVEVHVSTDPDFEPDTLTLASTIETPQGGTVAVPLGDYATRYVRLRARNTSGAAGHASDEDHDTPKKVDSPDLSDLIDLVPAGSITATEIADNAVTTPKLVASAVTAGKIATDAVTAGKFNANAVTAREITSGQVNAAHIATGSLTSLLLAGDIIRAGAVNGAGAPINGNRVEIQASGIKLITRTGGVDAPATVDLSTATGAATFTGNITGSTVTSDDPDLGGYAQFTNGAVSYYTGTPGGSHTLVGQVSASEDTWQAPGSGDYGLYLAGAMTATEEHQPTIQLVSDIAGDDSRIWTNTGIGGHTWSINGNPWMALISADGLTASLALIADLSGYANAGFLGTVTAGALDVTGAVSAPKKMQSGSRSITPSAANVKTTSTVTFDPPFDTTPRIVVSPNTSTTDVTQCTFSSPSATGFTINLTRINTTATGVNWIAMAD